MAVYLCRQLGGYRLTDIGKAVGLDNPSSVGTAYLKMKRRVEQGEETEGGRLDYPRKKETTERVGKHQPALVLVF